MKEAEGEAWVRKPKRIVQNQILIQIMMIFTVLSPVVFSGLLFWLISLCPWVPPYIIGAWAIALITFAVLKTRVIRQSKKALKSKT